MEYSLSENQYLKLAEKYNVIPVCSNVVLDIETPVSIYIKSGAFQKQYSFILESVIHGSHRGQYSIIGISAYSIAKGKNQEYYYHGIQRNDISQKLKSNYPIDALQEAFSQFQPWIDDKIIGFSCGAVGFFSYDIIRYYENITGKTVHSLQEQIQSMQKDPLQIEDFIYIFPQLVVILDHTSGKVHIVYNIFIEQKDNLRSLYKEATKSLESLVKDIKQSHFLKAYYNLPLPLNTKKENFLEEKSWNCNIETNVFIENIKICKEYIKAGDIFQVVPSKRFSRPYSYDPFFLYRSLRVTNPSPYMVYLHFPEVCLIGSSPEIQVKTQGDIIITRPIAGTIKRGKDDIEDSQLGKQLLSDEKEIAEHIMLVDLTRNDIGKISQYGTVKVKELMCLEKYSHVMHIVSQVEGIMQKQYNSFDALQCSFPIGTITGAPKIRAMEIIETMEPEKRGVFSGCIGFFRFDGNLDSCISIRTMVWKKNVLYVQAGIGLVHDSIPEKENKEVYQKCSSSFQALEIAYSDNMRI